MFSITTVALSTNIPIANPKPLRDIILIVCPHIEEQIIAKSTDNGIDIPIMKVERTLPKNINTISAVKIAASVPENITSRIAFFTKIDWSNNTCIFTLSGIVFAIVGNSFFVPSTTFRDETLPALYTAIKEPGEPFSLTMFVWIALPSCIYATSDK